MSKRDLEIVDVAARHHGVVARTQLLELGLSSATISRRVQAGALRPVRRGVYVVTSIESEHSRVAALALGVEGSVISHRSAAALHGMPLVADRPTVTVAKGAHVAVEGCRVVETRFLPPDDVGITRGLPTTTAARTLCDLAAELRPGHVRQLVQEQTIASRPTMPALIACHQALRRRGRTGTRAMRVVLSALTDDQPMPESELERMLAEALVAGGVAGLRRQFAPPWYDGVQGIVDFADPASRTVIEADGRAWHTIDRHAARDRHRDRTALAHGWVVVRVGWAELTERPEATVDEIRAVLAERRVSFWRDSTSLVRPTHARTDGQSTRSGDDAGHHLEQRWRAADHQGVDD